MKSSRATHLHIVLSFGLLLTACGGGGGGGDSGPTTTTGYFKDTNAEGVSFESGEITGVTGTDGRFTCESGKPVKFSVGDVELGTTTCGPVVTPVDLVAGGSIDNTAVQNVVRFLLMLDHDEDPENGIQISDDVLAAAADWGPVEFDVGATDFGSLAAVTGIMSEVATIDGRGVALADASSAKTHLEATVRCAYAGAFAGTYGGDDAGYFGVLVDARDGSVSGYVYSTAEDGTDEVSGSSPMSLDQTRAFVSGTATTGASFSGRFPTANTVAGKWTNTYYGQSGAFSGKRVGGSPSAVYRFTGSFEGSDHGLFTFDIDSNDGVTGVSYSVVEDHLATLSGTVADTFVPGLGGRGGDYVTVISGKTADGATTFDGTLSRSTGALSGSWSWTDGIDSESGSFSGSGCKLN